MKHVGPLRYGVMFKKAFCAPEIFTAFVRDMLGITIEIESVETEKEFASPIGRVLRKPIIICQRFEKFLNISNRIPSHLLNGHRCLMSMGRSFWMKKRERKVNSNSPGIFSV